MKHLFLIILLFLLGSIGYALPNENDINEKLENLQEKILNTYGITIKKSYDNYSDNNNQFDYIINDTEFKSFLQSFSREAEKQNLNNGEIQRYFPLEIPLIIYRDNTTCESGDEVCFVRDKIYAKYDSTSEAVEFIIQNFPLENTDLAENLELRNKAIKNAILELVKKMKDEGITIISYHFTTFFEGQGDSNLTNETILYSTQENLLQGLLKLKKEFDKYTDKTKFPTKILITNSPQNFPDDKSEYGYTEFYWNNDSFFSWWWLKQIVHPSHSNKNQLEEYITRHIDEIIKREEKTANGDSDVKKQNWFSKK